MRHIKSLLIILVAVLLGFSMEANAATCNQSFTASGKTITANFETIDGKYVITLMASGSDYFSVPNSWYVGGTNWASNVISGAGTGTLVLRFNANPNLNSSGLSWYMNGNTSTNYQVYGWQMPAIDWSGTCGPADTHNPVISSVVAQSTTQTSITVRVTTTDTQTDDSGVASITVTRRDNSQSQTETISPATGSVYRDFVFSGLTAGTTYTFDVTVTDAAGRTASTSQNLATQAAVVDNTLPTISSAAAENIKATTADIRVQATDNIGVTKVVIKNGETTIKEENISSTASLNQTFTLTGLTKNTTYNNIKVIVYDARPNASSTYSVANFTTKDTKIIYFVKSGNSSGWGATKVHYDGGWEATTWPGVNMTNTGMTNCDNSQIWRAEIPDNTTVVVFNNGSSGGNNQSANQTPLANQYFNFERNTWYSPENLYLLGEGSPMSWTRSSDTKFSTWNGSTPTSVTKTLRLTGSSYYQFKVQYYDGVNEWWRGNNGTMESNNCTKWLMNEANNCQIHTTTTGNYTFTYDFTANKLSVTYPIPPVGCEGTSNYCTSGGNNFVHYTLKYIGGNILFTVNSTTASPLQTCKVSYARNTSGQDAVNNVGMTVTDGVATYTLPATGVYASGTMYFYFTYKTAAMGSEGSSASGFSSGAFQYNIGGCVLDDGIPYMLSASKAGATTTSVTLNVNGVVNVSGVETPVTQYRVSVDGGAYSTYTASAGQITITGLTADTEYNFIVKAYYNGDVSENSKTVTAATNKVSQCSGERGHYADASWAKIQYSIDYNSSTKEMSVTVTCATQTLNWLGIQWDVPGIQGSAGMETSFTNGVYTTTVTDAMIGNAMGIRIEYGYTGRDGHSVTADGVNPNASTGVIYYVVGECGCLPDDGDNPTMGSASVASKTTTSVTLNVSATDPSSTVSIYTINSKDYTALDGKITIEGLTPCTTYNWDIYAKDLSCNVSDNHASVSFTTPQNHASAAAGATATFVYEGNADFRGEKTIDGNLTTRGGTQKMDAELAEALANAVLTVDMKAIKSVNEIDIYWERACATDYELQASVDGTHWATIERYTDMPKWKQDADPKVRGVDNEVYSFYPLPARYLRVKPNTLYVAAKWGMSIYEFEAYGDCDATEQQCPVMLGVRSVSTRSQEAVISVGAIDQQTPNSALLTYIVTVNSTTLSGRDITNTYTFAPSDAKRENLAETAQLTIEGLVPGTNYDIMVKARDPQGNESCNENAIAIRTGKAQGCTLVREGSDAKVTGDWHAFPAGMTYRLELENNDAGDEFTATLTFSGKPAGMTISTVYFAIQKQTTGTDCYAGWVEVAMGKSGDVFTRTFHKNDTYTRKGQDVCDEVLSQDYHMPLFPDWPHIGIYFKMETNDPGIIHTNEFVYNAAEKTCEEHFIIFHDGSEPESDMLTQYAGGTIEEEIFYYRLFNPGQWAPLCLPFVVDRVTVFDPDDKAYYDLTPQRNSNPSNNAAGVKTPGEYWIRQQKMDVSGADFVDSWYDANDALPQKNIAYNFRVPTAGGYYQNKYILFHGAAGQTINSSWTLGAASTSNDQYRLYGNTTMMPQSLTKAYKEDADGTYYRLKENWTLNPFECYIVASSETMARMPIIRRWVYTDTATGWEEIDEETILPEIRVYTILGQPIAVYEQISASEVVQRVAATLGTGYYILSAGVATTKLIVP